jgi:hypothetical protein
VGEAQQAGKVYRVGLVFTTAPVSEMIGPDPVHPLVRSFLDELRTLGYVQGRNLVFEPRSAEGKFERFREILEGLVRLNADDRYRRVRQLRSEDARCSLRSPEELIVVTRQSGTVAPSFKWGFLTAAFVATLVSGVATAAFTSIGTSPSQKDVLTFAASMAGLPRLAESYALSSDPQYYHQGDLAYALAVASNDRKESEKYRQLIVIILQLRESKCGSSWSTVLSKVLLVWR